MLQITPEFQAQLREMLAARESNAKLRSSVSISASRQRHLGADKFKHLVEVVAAILKEGKPTIFAYEGACRHGIRSTLCLEGWPWADADIAAASVLSTAFVLVGAERPTWQQGQPEYTQDGYSPIERTMCVHCGNKLPPVTHGIERKYCSHVCRIVHVNTVAKRSGERVSRAEYLARVASEKKRRREENERDCEHCGCAYTPKFGTQAGQQYCSKKCHYDAVRMPERFCAQCGTGFQPRLATMKFCSHECSAKFKVVIRPPKPCERCGTEFVPSKSSSSFCSKSCSEFAKNERTLDDRRPERSCPACRGIFRVKPSSPKTFCSRRCASITRFPATAFRCSPADTEERNA